MWIDKDTFKTVVGVAPLVSIDLVVERADGNILLGQRINRPAQGYWFVPGGRILKDESLNAAFRRLSLGELGQTFELQQAQFLGVYEHFYTDSVFGEGDVNPSTHYVVLGFHLKLNTGVELSLPTEQHDNYRWLSSKAISEDSDVHKYSRAYLAALSPAH